jgi:arginine-tRNA-protein transferase
MARQLQHFIEREHPCAYLPQAQASLEHRTLIDVSPQELERLLSLGFRRFGPDYFRPACQRCSECVPTRIVVDEFAPSKSQRRARRQCDRFTIVVGRPRVDAERLRLYSAWHASREAARQWEQAPIDAETYEQFFANAHPCAREIAYFDPEANGRLIGVGICDETASAWSAVYFFYDPSYARCSLGTANVLFQVEHARARALRHLYLGYRVRDCPSLRYKAQFAPQEVLLTRPRLTDEPRWTRAPTTRGLRR